MLRLLLALLCVVFATDGAARAEGANHCTSITDQDCAPLPRVNVGRDHRVEIFTRQRTISFPVPSGEAGEELRLICTNGKCDCSEHVQFFEFKGPHKGFARINDIERSAASKTHCSVENANVARDALRFEISRSLISTAIFEIEYCHGCGGSCHGSTTLATYDELDGRLLKVGDVLKPGAAEALRRHMIDYMVAKHGREEGNASLGQRLTQDLANRALLNEGFYAERGTLYINLSSFALSCADGSFFPIPIPPQLIKPELAGLLR